MLVAVVGGALLGMGGTTLMGFMTDHLSVGMSAFVMFVALPILALSVWAVIAHHNDGKYGQPGETT
jgi:hypothetical protein